MCDLWGLGSMPPRCATITCDVRAYHKMKTATASRRVQGGAIVTILF